MQTQTKTIYPTASLVTAITFHQLFEGLSLGIRIAALPSPSHLHSTSSSHSPSSHSPSRSSLPLDTHALISKSDHAGRNSQRSILQPTLSILFALTTPLGMGVGLRVFTRGVGGDSEDGTSFFVKFKLTSQFTYSLYLLPKPPHACTCSLAPQPRCT